MYHKNKVANLRRGVGAGQWDLAGIDILRRRSVQRYRERHDLRRTEVYGFRGDLHQAAQLHDTHIIRRPAAPDRRPPLLQTS